MEYLENHRNKKYQALATVLECIILIIISLLVLIIVTRGFKIGPISITHFINPLIILLFVLLLRKILLDKFKINEFTILQNPISYLSLILFFVTALFVINNYVMYTTFDFSNFHDLALYNQSMFNFVHGRGFMEIIWGNRSIFAEHSEFFLIPVSLIYVCWQSPLTLLFIQSIVVALGVIPLYFLARQKLKNGFLPIIICLSYLTFPGILNLSSLVEFRSIIFVIPILFSAFYFYELDKRNIFIILMLLASLVKEEVPLVVATTGLYILIFSKKKKINRKIGLIILLIGTALFFYIIYVFIPSYRGASYPHFTRFVSGSDNLIVTLKDLLKFNKPEYFHIDKIDYFFDLFLRLGFFPLFSFAFLIPLSNWLQCVLSPNPSVISQHWHNVLIFTFLFISLIYGISNLKRIHKKLVNIALSILFLIVIIFGLKCFKNIVVAPLQWRGVFVKTFSIERYDYLMKAIEIIPQDSSVYTTFKLLPYVSSREKVYWFPKVGKETAINWTDIDYILFSNDNDFLNSQDKDKLKEAIKSKLFNKIKTFGEFQVWKRR